MITTKTHVVARIRTKDQALGIWADRVFVITAEDLLAMLHSHYGFHAAERDNLYAITCEDIARERRAGQDGDKA